MDSFRGQFNCNVDDKGRIKLPVLLKAQFPAEDEGKFMLKKGLDDCLEIYTLAGWRLEEDKLRMLDRYNPTHRKFRGQFTEGLIELSLDSSDRLLVPKSLMQYIHNAREVIVKGELDCIQIWDVKAFEKFMDSDPTELHNMSIEISKYIDEQKAKK